MVLGDLVTFLRLVLAAVLGGLVGIEREAMNRPAGFRTHILVCVGSALIMMVSNEMTLAFRGIAQADPGRIAAQVVSGIGFLGAGTILREGGTVHGLTTAASLWVMAAVGLAVGAGMYKAAVATTSVVVGTLLLQRRMQHMAAKKCFRTITVESADRPGLLGRLGMVLGAHGINITNVQMEYINGNRFIRIIFHVTIPRDLQMADVLPEIMAIEGIRSAEAD
ncbi:MAG: MgtC/SapB family protein [Bacillota bacterium]